MPMDNLPGKNSLALRIKNIQLKFAKANMKETKINNLSGWERFLNPIFKVIFWGSFLFSFTKNKGIKEIKAKIAAMIMIDLKLKPKNQNKRKTIIEPKIAPEVSIVL